MMNELLIYGFWIPTAFIFLNFGLYHTFLAFNEALAISLKEITHTWVSFLRRGIPVPSDYNEMGYGRFIGEAFLVRPEYHTTQITLGKQR